MSETLNLFKISLVDECISLGTRTLKWCYGHDPPGVGNDSVYDEILTLLVSVLVSSFDVFFRTPVTTKTD